MAVPPSPSAAAAAAAAAKVLGPTRRDVLNLYRSLLRIHMAVLPAAQRALGDRVRIYIYITRLGLGPPCGPLRELGFFPGADPVN